MTLVSRKTLLKGTQRFVDLTRTTVHDKYTYDWPRTLYTSISPQAFLYGLNSPQEVPHGAVGIHIQATSLELGEILLSLVFEDVNLDQAVAAVLVSKFRFRHVLVPIVFSSTRPCMRNSLRIRHRRCHQMCHGQWVGCKCNLEPLVSRHDPNTSRGTSCNCCGCQMYHNWTHWEVITMLLHMCIMCLSNSTYEGSKPLFL